MELLPQHIEAIIFSSDRPVHFHEMIECLNKVSDDFYESADIRQILQDLMTKYNSPEYAFNLREVGGGYQFLSKSHYHGTITAFLNQKSRRRLSSASLETIAIIAYKQPVTKAEIERIRGVNCDYTLNRLLDKELIVISGREDGPGRPLLYTTSDAFMDYFGINSVKDLPTIGEVKPAEDNVIGVPLAN